MGIMDTKKELTQIAKVRIGLCCISFLSAIAAFVECKGTILPLHIMDFHHFGNLSIMRTGKRHRPHKPISFSNG